MMEYDYNTTWISLASSAISSACTYFITKRKRKHEDIQLLQSSIELLSKNYNDTIRRVCELQAQNIELSAEIKKLQTENKELRLCITDLQSRYTDILPKSTLDIAKTNKHNHDSKVQS